MKHRIGNNIVVQMLGGDIHIIQENFSRPNDMIVMEPQTVINFMNALTEIQQEVKAELKAKKEN